MAGAVGRKRGEKLSQGETLQQGLEALEWRRDGHYVGLAASQWSVLPVSCWPHFRQKPSASKMCCWFVLLVSSVVPDVLAKIGVERDSDCFVASFK